VRAIVIGLVLALQVGLTHGAVAAEPDDGGPGSAYYTLVPGDEDPATLVRHMGVSGHRRP